MDVVLDALGKLADFLSGEDVVRMPVEVGDDGQTWTWVVPSFTTPGEEYEVSCDRDGGAMWCSCMDATCRKKRGTIIDSGNLCKHCKVVLRLLDIRRKNKWSL
jgi:hypothetical protein